LTSYDVTLELQDLFFLVLVLMKGWVILISLAMFSMPVMYALHASGVLYIFAWYSI